MEKTLKDGKMLANLSGIENGIAIKILLYQKEKYAYTPFSDFSLSDLSLPKKDRREVRAEIKHEESLKSIPVVVLITSKHKQDILNVYYLQTDFCINETLNLK